MFKFSYLPLCLAVLASCGNTDAGTDPDKALSAAHCFKAMDYDYEALLSQADIEKHVSIDAATFKKTVSSTKGKYGSCDYSWKSDRPDIQLEISGMTIQQADRNRVAIKMLDFYDHEDLKRYNQESVTNLFDQGYKVLSPEEYEGLLANLQQQFAGSPEKLEQAKGFLDARMTSAYTPLDGLGDRAYWKWSDNHGIQLVVLHGPTQFTIETKLSAEAQPSLDAAVQFAKAVLGKCK